MELAKKILDYKNPHYDWQEQMRNTPQDPLYHGEGDVFTHTAMVVDALTNDPDFLMLIEKEQKVLLAAAFFHDIAKPFCTRAEDGRIVSPGHTIKGAAQTRKLLYCFDFFKDLLGTFSFSEREKICSLVRHHGLPLHFLDKPDMKKDLFKASLELNLFHLSILAKADITGRICQDKQPLFETIELFKDTCREYDCLEQPKHFINERSMLFYMLRGDQYLHYAPHEESGSHVYMMAGLPASGKDTYVNTEFDDYPVISLDQIRGDLSILPTKRQGKVIQAAKKQAKLYLAQKQDFIWNATNIAHSNRTSLIQLFLDYNAKVHIIYREAPYQEILRRNAKRTKPVPEKAIHSMIDRLDIPKLWEADSVTYDIQA